ncbi:hypothetical protein A9404_06180 [Halothiobacillus diazotrophicus]|uniref:Uncharacterized protein n=1 Tax=Halothiobacillus diazotrophicus TaxID=1860122 RepID=A0A191ZGP1_9GAMM|nr:hypothetical protein [Halothiobacillus diazotrophicus]ANJ67022.1 hypothetical protein A9404_06180 [Halothiobacillus diazotrophicus]
MENESRQLPVALTQSAEYADQWHTYFSSVKPIDDAFIARGFKAVKAYIDRDEELCGTGSYATMIYQLSHQQKIDEWRTVGDALFQEMMVYEEQGEIIPSGYIKRIIDHPVLACHAKLNLLSRCFKEEYYSRVIPHLPALRDARLEERRQLATIWGQQPLARLQENSAINLRKEVMNSVFTDAFGALGFEKRSTKAGVIRMHKPLTSQFAMIVEPDNYCLLRRGICDSGEKYDELYGADNLNWMTYIGSTNKKDRTNWLTFIPPFHSYPFSLYGYFRSTHEMEVSIRAKALIYELLISPFEKIFKKYG